MEMRRSSVTFPRMRGSGPRVAQSSINFGRSVQRAVAGLVGFSSGFRGDDHHLGNLNLRLDTAIDDDVVNVSVTYGLRDWSGNWDDDYHGVIQFVVLADLVPITAPPPRGDISIVDMELNQAIQFFRSDQHLDAANARPNNSIPLIARKDTGVRLYVDYDATSGLPVINSLSGTLEVRTSIGSTTLALAPHRRITPRRDSTIDRGQVNHTLNFMIPEGWCQGELQLRAWVYDERDPNQKSGIYERTIRFQDREPLRIFGVGVHYTGQGLNLAAPSITDFENTMIFTEKTFPVPEVFLSGFTTIRFDEDMQANIGDGCGEGFSELLDRLEDLRGDSSDIYYGILPNGVNTGNVGGCGRSGVGAGFELADETASEEIGHAFGLKHSPCNDTHCAFIPANQDQNYPDYDSYQSDSIGEFGYDPAANMVYNPANTYDFMGYSNPEWVSPYTYLRLTSRFPMMNGGAASPTAFSLLRASFFPGSSKTMKQHDNEWIRKKMMTLFLRVFIDRERNVFLNPSFNFPSLPARPNGTPTDFVTEILDQDGKVLTCQQLITPSAHCRPFCWPKKFSQRIPFPERGETLIIREGDEVIFKQKIPKPPKVKLRKGFDEKTDSYHISWNAGVEDEENVELWYLVQWEDDDGSWRGLQPRSREPEAFIPLWLFRKRKKLSIRVLATTGLATGMAEDILEIEQSPDESVHLSPSTGSNAVGTLKVVAFDNSGRSVSDADIIWHDDSGGEIGRGRSVNIHHLAAGQHVLRTTVINHGPGECEANWLVEKLADGTIKILTKEEGLDYKKQLPDENDKGKKRAKK